MYFCSISSCVALCWRFLGKTKQILPYILLQIHEPSQVNVPNLRHTKDLSGLVRKYLPPGTIYETYQFYCGWCSAHSVEHQASCHVIQLVVFFVLFNHLCCFVDILTLFMRYGTFLKRWNAKWTTVLKYRDASAFSQCDICQELKSQYPGFGVIINILKQLMFIRCVFCFFSNRFCSPFSHIQ